MSGGRTRQACRALRLWADRADETVRSMISGALLSTGLAASILGSACSGATVTPPDAPAGVESAAVRKAIAPASAPDGAPSSSQPNSQPNSPSAHPASEAGSTPQPEPHPYDFLWKAAASGVNPFEHRPPSAADPRQDGTPVASPAASASKPGKEELKPGNLSTHEADDPIDGVASAEIPNKDSDFPNAPDPAAPGIQGNDPDLLALQGDGGWRKQDLQELAPYLQGIASWYGPNFHGKLTANGETYNQYGLTAAHPVLPIGTRIMVENLNNGNRVWVRVNDRGPYAKGRILDLSYIAAERLGMIEQGTAPVRITVLQWPNTLQASFGLKSYQQFTVQMAAYPELDTAENLRERLQARFPQYPFFIEPASKGFFAVAAGPFDDEREAKGVSRQIHRSGYTPLVRRYRN